ncbi:uncharacterized protein I303_103151 [Kwoniella dejecticola CBS 10117]|uniref:Mediator complex subunit 9 n=1 Tax=Kwoniella dejecticola CBS 10117 TaxID=1296121 RepID=A0A1A6AAR0_9TREE|nr:uncharacterized protein I303_03172 [Kwoniella dejecticola CBS 10117]OBR87148.1 hypothetical protein I303_03172 [Kwoniella dejecticola CBS 10117]
MVQQLTLPSASTSTSTPIANTPTIQPGTFQSILPLVDDLLGIIHGQATSEGGNRAQAGESVALKAKELATTLGGMKVASMELPGGQLSIDEIRRLSVRLDEEADKRIRILEAFEQRHMPLIEQLSSSTRSVTNQNANGRDSSSQNGETSVADAPNHGS